MANTFVHVEIIIHYSLYTILQCQCFSTPLKKVAREIKSEIYSGHCIVFMCVCFCADLQFLVSLVSSSERVLHLALFEEELLCLSGQLTPYFLQLTLQLTTSALKTLCTLTSLLGGAGLWVESWDKVLETQPHFYLMTVIHNT